MHWLLLTLIVLYQFVEGVIQGYIWSEYRYSNFLISPDIHHGQGFLDFHAWRFLETLTIMGLVFVGTTFTNYLELGFTLLGAWWIGFFVYERSLNYVDVGHLFPHKPNFKILWWSIPRHPWQDFFILFIGSGVFYYGVSL